MGRRDGQQRTGGESATGAAPDNLLKQQDNATLCAHCSLDDDRAVHQLLRDIHLLGSPSPLTPLVHPVRLSRIIRLANEPENVERRSNRRRKSPDRFRWLGVVACPSAIDDHLFRNSRPGARRRDGVSAPGLGFSGVMGDIRRGCVPPPQRDETHRDETLLGFRTIFEERIRA